MKYSVFIALLCVSAISSVSFQAAGDAPAKKRIRLMPPPQVMLEKVTPYPDNTPKEYVGLIAGSAEVDLPPRVSGFLEDCLYKEGEMVKKGQLLFKIEDTTYRAKVDSLKAQIKQNEADLEYAISNFRRKETLIRKEASSKSSYEEAQRLLKTSEAALAASKASLLDAENNLSYTKVYAPMDSLAGKSTYSPGNYITPSSASLASLVKVNPIRIKFSISERDFLNFIRDRKNPSDAVKISVRMANGEKYTGGDFKIIIVSNKVDNTTGTIMLWAQGPNKNLQLIPGGYVNVTLSAKQVKEKPSVPLTAVMSDRNGSYVYTVGPDKVAHKRNIRTGAINDDRQIVEEGLKSGELIVSEGTHKVIPGTPVEGVLASEAGKSGKK